MVDRRWPLLAETDAMRLRGRSCWYAQMACMLNYQRSPGRLDQGLRPSDVLDREFASGTATGSAR